ncbi:MAG TPA: GDSL-type esterase/lipase family protein [Opitutales bacterium]|nr:GDSL-type esterase/lipase family protein [Opitutales bacterium]
MKYPTKLFPFALLALALALQLGGCATPEKIGGSTPLNYMPTWPDSAGAFNVAKTTAEPPGPRDNPALKPVPQSATGNYQTVHQRLVIQAKQGDIDLLFVGDSITDFWIGVSSARSATGKAVWDANYGSLKAADFAYTADKTQNVLWRLQNGEGQGFSPKVVVLMIGTNNTGVVTRGATTAAGMQWRNTNDEAIAGVTAVVAELRKDFPAAKILLLAIFPRGDDELAMQQIPVINQAIAKLDDQQHVFFLDIGPKFLGADGHVNPTLFQTRDRLHPTAAGYTVWADAMRDTLAKLLKD